MKNIVLAACMAVASLLCPVAAQAKPITYTFAGSVLFGEDVSHSFDGGDLTGESFLVREVFDLDYADGTAGPNGTEYYASLGNQGFARATIRIGAVSKEFPGAFGSFEPLQHGFHSLIGDKGFGIGDYIYALLRFDAGPAGVTGSYATSDDYGQTYNNVVFSVTSHSISPVPLPPALPMLAAALLGLAGVSRLRTGVRAARSCAAP